MPFASSDLAPACPHPALGVEDRRRQLMQAAPRSSPVPAGCEDEGAHATDGSEVRIAQGEQGHEAIVGQATDSAGAPRSSVPRR